MKTLKIASLIAGSLILVGCVLPIPHRRLHSGGIEATIIDAKTASPVTGAKVLTHDGSRVLAEVDSKGQFKISPKYGWHGAYLVGPISYSLLPHFDIPYPHPPLRIDSEGYQSRTVQPFDEVMTDKSNGRILIPLQPR
jgi:hypothetical protein